MSEGVDERALGDQRLHCEGWLIYDGTIIVLYAAPAMHSSSYYTQRGLMGWTVRWTIFHHPLFSPVKSCSELVGSSHCSLEKKDGCQCKAMSETIADFILTQLCILSLCHGLRYCKMQAEDLLLDKLHLYLALLATFGYVQKNNIDSNNRYHPQNSCHPSPCSPKSPTYNMAPNDLHEANKVGTCWYVGGMLLACRLFERREILLKTIIGLSIP